MWQVLVKDVLKLCWLPEDVMVWPVGCNLNTEKYSICIGSHVILSLHMCLELINDTVVRASCVEVIYMKKVQLNLIGREGTVQISCLQLPKICEPVPAVSLAEWREPIIHHRLQLADGVEKRKTKW